MNVWEKRGWQIDFSLPLPLGNGLRVSPLFWALANRRGGWAKARSFVVSHGALPKGNGNKDRQIKSKDIQDPRPLIRLSKTRYVRIVSRHYCSTTVNIIFFKAHLYLALSTIVQRTIVAGRRDTQMFRCFVFSTKKGAIRSVRYSGLTFEPYQTQTRDTFCQGPFTKIC